MKHAVQEREIEYLVHFTRIKNLSSIFEHGLLPVASLSARQMEFKKNDQYRYDNCEEATCMSIQFPNYRMFSKYRFQEPNVEWIVLGIRKEVLWEKDCVFCIENAASNNETTKSLQERRGIEAFNRLYDEYPGKPTRNQLGLRKALPTHPQAEVLVFNQIEPSYIWGIAFKDVFTQNKYASLVPSNVKSQVSERMFKYRDDFEYWR